MNGGSPVTYRLSWEGERGSEGGSGGRERGGGRGDGGRGRGEGRGDGGRRKKQRGIYKRNQDTVLSSNTFEESFIVYFIYTTLIYVQCTARQDLVRGRETGGEGGRKVSCVHTPYL